MILLVTRATCALALLVLLIALLPCDLTHCLTICAAESYMTRVEKKGKAVLVLVEISTRVHVWIANIRHIDLFQEKRLEAPYRRRRRKIRNRANEC
jgi:hypothetical protein